MPIALVASASPKPQALAESRVDFAAVDTETSVERDRHDRARAALVILSVSVALSAGPATQAAQAKPSSALHGAQVRAAHFEQLEDARLHLPSVPIKVHIASHNLTGTTNGKTFEAGALTDPLDAAGLGEGPETHCEIEFSPRLFSGSFSAEQIDGAAAHEVFHCLEGQLSGNLARFNGHSSWLVEGAAEWVESALVPNDSNVSDSWLEYLDSPGTPLFKRDYDAVGFFGHLSSSGISPWSVMRSMFAADNDAQAYQASGAGTRSAQESEASEFFGAPELGDEWTAWHQTNAEANANVPRTHQVPPTIRVSAHPPKPLMVKPMADGIYRLVDDASRTTISVTGGFVRLRSTEAPELNESGVKDLTLCRPGAAGSCRCANDPGGSAKPFTVGDLAVTGGAGGATVTITPSTSCDIPQRSCSSVVSLTDFPPPVVGVFEPTTVIETASSESAGPGGFATECTYAAPPPPSSGATVPSPLGFADLIVYGTDTQAQAEYAKELAAFPALHSSAAIGDQAVTTANRGLMQIDNAVFLFEWLPISAADESVGAESVLRDVLGSLCPGCG